MDVSIIVLDRETAVLISVHIALMLIDSKNSISVFLVTLAALGLAGYIFGERNHLGNFKILFSTSAAWLRRSPGPSCLRTWHPLQPMPFIPGPGLRARHRHWQTKVSAIILVIRGNTIRESVSILILYNCCNSQFSF